MSTKKADNLRETTVNDLYVIFDGNMDKLSPGENCPFLCNYALIGFCASQIVPKVEI